MEISLLLNNGHDRAVSRFQCGLGSAFLLGRRIEVCRFKYMSIWREFGGSEIAFVDLWSERYRWVCTLVPYPSGDTGWALGWVERANASKNRYET